jgi:hypothetical protein
MDLSKINCCCVGFKSTLNDKGFSIRIEQDKHDDLNKFYLKFRAVDLDKKSILLDAFKERLIGMKLPNLSFEGEVQIVYCPWCGKKL